jgi:ferredoxin-nitrate reductase
VTSIRDGAPLIKWTTPEAAFDAWKECSQGRPCDYTGLSYDKLSAVSGIHWPCNVDHPNGEARLYTTLNFPTDPADCETYGHDLVTGAPISSESYRARNPAGGAILRAAEYENYASLRCSSSSDQTSSKQAVCASSSATASAIALPSM